MAIGTTNSNRARRMHGDAVNGRMAAGTHTATRLGVGFFLSLSDQELGPAPLSAFADIFVLIG